MNKACHHDRLFNWKLFKHVDILAKTLWVQRYGDSPTFAIPKTWDLYLDRYYNYSMSTGVIFILNFLLPATGASIII
jgi:hypothetical protein